MGDAVAVKLMEAAPVTGGLRFELAEGGAEPAAPHTPGSPGPASPGTPDKAPFQAEKALNFRYLTPSA